MRQIMRRTAGVAAALALTVTVVAGCSDDSDDNDASASSGASTMQSADASSTDGSDAGANAEDVKLKAADGTDVTLTGSIAAKYSSATEKQKTDLGKPLTGDDAAGTSDSGVVFQQFDGGVITAKNADAGTPAYITWGKIRDAWNVKRDDSGKPSEDGKGGSDGPLGTATSDETEEGTVKKSTFEHGSITWDKSTDKTVVMVNGEEVPTE